ncbi:AMP-binding protein [Schinkia azotoformans]|uniref:AMP-binding protein n=1 Tax=Schinkia azotoformans TaxID=1454 RepID=UPI002DB784E6|nr:AMP-binding protein [Schinkia azotoformans]MEC1741954.1 AMP-binding protein [Schinkia azotoformans]MEC1766404.1 AMP-binding protein [Schinkia azotoformans]MEC1771294.1 AMP-binding protein [Schinkia azotoformans]MEC1786416.1 AMP-binding protein [Schinkia azotoformans]MED4365452.1 AMP-binding protein [Schinkia azotoformans]
MSNNAVWFPDNAYIESTRLFQWMKQLGFDDYDAFYEKSIQDIEWFWDEAVKTLGIEWYQPYSNTLNLSDGIKWPKWFGGGKSNVVYNAVEKWAESEKTRDQIALIWESDDGEVIRYSFGQLNEEIAKAAKGLLVEGIQKGDVISIYMPMIPETVIAMMAIAKIGAIFSPAFSGYGADAVATRINAANAKMLITADGFLRRGKQVSMKNEADRAVGLSPSIEKVIIVKRLNNEIPWQAGRDLSWEELIKKGQNKNGVKTLELESDEPLMLLYTSGTTGKPKGAVHTHTGFPLKAAFDAGLAMDVKQGDTLFWYTDMGWMMGPFLVYGGLINGASILLFEGTPDFPNPDRIWEVTSKHGATHLGISPTLIRSLMKHGEEWAHKHDLSKLHAIGSTGEPWNPEPWMWLFEKVGMKRIPIINYSGGTEISGGILGNVLVKPIGPITFNSPIPGMEVHVYDENGNPVIGEVGELVISKPWVGMTNGFWNEPERYEKSYWDRWPNTWVHGDWVIKDDDGFYTITGRSDDILNVAGKRLGPAELESILVEHPDIVEAGTIGVPDDVKGEVAICFAVLKGEDLDTVKIKNEAMELVAEKIGKALKPKEIFFVHDLPKTRNAKVMRRAIKAGFLNKDAGDLSSLENPHTVEAIRELGKEYYKQK